MSTSLDPRIIDILVLGQGDRRRQLQDFPILGDVWAAMAAAPTAMHDLLISPYHGTDAGRVASFVSDNTRKNAAGREPRRVSYLNNLVVARLSVADICTTIVAGTRWWQNLMESLGGGLANFLEDLPSLINGQLELEILRSSPPSQETDSRRHQLEQAFDERLNAERQLIRLGLVIGVIAAARDAGEPTVIKTIADAADALGRERISRVGSSIVASIDHSYRDFVLFENETGRDSTGVIYNVSANRPAEFAVSRSVPAIKADAARQLFSINCSEINWAVIDSGIDAKHPAFKDHSSKDSNANRVRATFDFKWIRDILDKANCFDLAARKALAKKLAEDDFGDVAANETVLDRIAVDLDEEREIDWNRLRPLIERRKFVEPRHPHGTHVAGILGGHWKVEGSESAPAQVKLLGVCPDIYLYDFRVLGSRIEQTEFAVIAALQFIQHLNSKGGRFQIHGVNMSLSIPHNVRNYACGRTPVCDAAEALVGAKVVVVAAAGNRGYQRYQLVDGEVFENYAASSITDPGNAENVITVGATHRYWPHTYGVSFFSSRGPTGDGRAKPDLLAPGERIESAVPGQGLDVMDGTSMAAPHVSGAAALIMARHREFRDKPATIKQMLCDHAITLGREASFQGRGMVDVLSAIQSK
jgi:serine protease AprX